MQFYKNFFVFVTFNLIYWNHILFHFYIKLTLKGQTTADSMSSSEGFKFGNMASVLRALSKVATSTKADSVLDYPLDEKNRDAVCSTLIEFNLRIIAIWIVSRPIIGYKKNANSFQHWTIKIQAPPILLSMGFVECDKMGAFRLDQTLSADQHLSNFLFYFIDNQRHRFEIVSSVTPSTNQHHQTKTLQEYMIMNTVQDKIEPINIRKRVCDISDFIEMWTHKNKKYNAITNNCQHFAVDLFAFLVHKQYPNQVNRAINLMDDGCEKKKYAKYLNVKEKKSQNCEHMDDEKIDSYQTSMNKTESTESSTSSSTIQ